MRRIQKKVCLLGDFAVGKTSLVQRFVYNRFSDKYLSTIGVKVSRKTVVVPEGDEVVEVTMMLWDLAGSQDFEGVRANYLRGAAGALLVCDMTRPETLASLERYLHDLQEVSAHAVTLLVANKSDLTNQLRFSAAQVEQMAAAHDTQAYLASAKTGANVEEVFRRLGQVLLEHTQ
ncbi:MAG: Rab family GTPase [Anaerolineae bacterium]|jgi:small GTP-binding protein|nr:Rab family GTPase [Anaerolineae bacterium]